VCECSVESILERSTLSANSDNLGNGNESLRSSAGLSGFDSTTRMMKN
jgi:hypothetical protein